MTGRESVRRTSGGTSADVLIMSVADAAAHYNISANAVRHRLRRGTITGEKHKSGWIVYVDATDVPDVQAPNKDIHADVADVLDTSSGTSVNVQLAILRESLVQPLVNENARLTDRIAELEREVGRLEERLNPAGDGAAEAPDVRPWYRRWFAG